MTNLSDMAAFVAVVEKGSFSQAGRELRVSTAVISARVAKLEKDLGIRLLSRTTRQVTPTDEAISYYKDCRQILEQVELAEATLSSRQNSPIGALKISAPVVFGKTYLAPLLAEFQRTYPEINIQLHISDSFVDPVKDGFDLVVRNGPLVNSSLIARKLADSPRLLCAAPNYLKEFGVPEKISDLLNHNCLLLRFPGSTQFQWEFGVGDARSVLPVTGKMDSNDSEVLCDWALSGLGICLKSRWEIKSHLESGALIEVLPDYPPTPVTVSALYPQGKILPLKMRLLLDYLGDGFKGNLT